MMTMMQAHEQGYEVVQQTMWGDSAVDFSDEWGYDEEEEAVFHFVRVEDSIAYFSDMDCEDYDE